MDKGQIQTFYHVDAFTQQLYRGNPAIVYHCAEMWDAEKRQRIASEHALPVTCFVVSSEEQYQFFVHTPTVEIPLCGHGMLASAFVLTRFGGEKRHQFEFVTESGVIPVQCLGPETIELGLSEALLEPDYTQAEAIGWALGKMPVEVLSSNGRLVAIYNNEHDIKRLTPVTERLAKIKAKGVIVTTEGEEYDVVLRAFAPGIGIGEDAVTGSAMCQLAPLWTERLGKKKLRVQQLSERKGEMVVTCREEKVWVQGSACLFAKGELYF